MNRKCMTEWFSVTALGNQKFILGLPWLEKHNPDVNWKTMTLEFRDSEKDEIKASLRSICQRIDRIAMPEREEDLIIRYLLSHKGPTKTDLQWKETFEDIGSWSEDTFGHLTITRYTSAQQMEHKYHQEEEVHMLPVTITVRTPALCLLETSDKSLSFMPTIFVIYLMSVSYVQLH